ncbi:MAG: winged helix-turn-helix transcriptional regulator [Armatimonadetes bacterium]|nr:winged helix-turn-helix transcriptional regulator [Anaerolineae bacterium]
MHTPDTTSTDLHPLTADQVRLMAMFKALGNPVRLQIMGYLAANPQCITGEIVAATPLAQATISQHLKVLRECGLVCGVTEGAAVCYCIDQDALAWFKAQVAGLF